MINSPHTKKSMDLAAHFSKAPWSAKEEIVDAFREESKHQQEVWDSQIHHQEVCGTSKSWETAEDFQDDSVSGNGASTDDQVH